MRKLDVEEGLDFVEEEIRRFHERCDTGDFHLLSCGPEPGRRGRGGGPIGAVIWACERERFEDCRKLIASLREAVEKLDVVVGVDVEAAMDSDGETWSIEFVKRVADLESAGAPSSG